MEVVNAPAASPLSAETLIEQLLSDPQQPVVMFQTRWCGYCHSARQLLQKLAVPHRLVDLDSEEYQSLGGGASIRAELMRRTGSRTVPQIFIGGEYIGGATETIAAFRDGSLHDKLQAHGIAIGEPG